MAPGALWTMPVRPRRVVPGNSGLEMETEQDQRMTARDEEHIQREPSQQYVFRRAIIAVAFSPRIKAVLNESFQIISRIEAEPVILHVGDDTPAARQRLEAAIENSDFGNLAPRFIVQRGTPVETLVRVAREQHADLIVAGAMKKGSFWNYFIGSVARQLPHQSPCSLLIFTDPREAPQAIERVHCAVEYDRAARLAIQATMGMAGLLNARELIFTHTFLDAAYEIKKPQLQSAEDIRRMYHRQDRRLQRHLQQFAGAGLRYRAQCLYERAANCTLAFASEIRADLFIASGPRNHASLWSRLAQQDFDRVFRDLPGSILLTRKPRYRIP